jgi:hypothetical protein
MKNTKKNPSTRAGSSKPRHRTDGFRTRAPTAKEDVSGLVEPERNRIDDGRLLEREIERWGERSELPHRRIATDDGWIDEYEPVRGRGARPLEEAGLNGHNDTLRERSMPIVRDRDWRQHAREDL